MAAQEVIALKIMASSTPDDGPLSEDPVARAMDRVLLAERTAQAAVSECERAGADLVERARHRARAILERAQARMVALHTRAAKELERCAAERTERRMKSAAVMVKQLSDPARRAAALERLAARLTRSESPRR